MKVLKTNSSQFIPLCSRNLFYISFAVVARCSETFWLGAHTFHLSFEASFFVILFRLTVMYKGL